MFLVYIVAVVLFVFGTYLIPGSSLSTENPRRYYRRNLYSLFAFLACSIIVSAGRFFLLSMAFNPLTECLIIACCIIWMILYRKEILDKPTT